jgi:small multidrug resistance pump
MPHTSRASMDTPAPASSVATGATIARPRVPPVYWVMLAVAIVSEVAATSLLKSTQGFTRLWPSVIVISLYELSFILLTITVRRIAVSVVYATWGGIGVALVTVVAWVWLDQALDAAALIGIGLIVAGVVVMQGFSKTTHA